VGRAPTLQADPARGKVGASSTARLRRFANPAWSPISAVHLNRS